MIEAKNLKPPNKKGKFLIMWANRIHQDMRKCQFYVFWKNYIFLSAYLFWLFFKFNYIIVKKSMYNYHLRKEGRELYTHLLIFF